MSLTSTQSGKLSKYKMICFKCFISLAKEDWMNIYNIVNERNDASNRLIIQALAWVEVWLNIPWGLQSICGSMRKSRMSKDRMRKSRAKKKEWENLQFRDFLILTFIGPTHK